MNFCGKVWFTAFFLSPFGGIPCVGGLGGFGRFMCVCRNT